MDNEQKKPTIIRSLGGSNEYIMGDTQEDRDKLREAIHADSKGLQMANLPHDEKVLDKEERRDNAKKKFWDNQSKGKKVKNTFSHAQAKELLARAIDATMEGYAEWLASDDCITKDAKTGELVHVVCEIKDPEGEHLMKMIQKRMKANGIEFSLQTDKK